MSNNKVALVRQHLSIDYGASDHQHNNKKKNLAHAAVTAAERMLSRSAQWWTTIAASPFFLLCVKGPPKTITFWHHLNKA